MPDLRDLVAVLPDPRLPEDHPHAVLQASIYCLSSGDTPWCHLPLAYLWGCSGYGHGPVLSTSLP